VQSVKPRRCHGLEGFSPWHNADHGIPQRWVEAIQSKLNGTHHRSEGQSGIVRLNPHGIGSNVPYCSGCIPKRYHLSLAMEDTSGAFRSTFRMSRAGHPMGSGCSASMCHLIWGSARWSLSGQTYWPQKSVQMDGSSWKRLASDEAFDQEVGEKPENASATKRWNSHSTFVLAPIILFEQNFYA